MSTQITDDDLARRAQAIIDDATGKYSEDAKLTISVLLANPNASDDDLRVRVEQVETGEFDHGTARESAAKPFKRERYGHHDIAPIFSRDTVDRLEPYAGREAIAEIERLTTIATSDEDQTVRGMAFLELIGHMIELDRGKDGRDEN